MDKIKSAWAAFDAKLPRMWKEWLVSALLIAALAFFVVSWSDRVGLILAKVPLLTIGGLLGYYGDRGLFPYARPGDILEQFNERLKAVAELPISGRDSEVIFPSLASLSQRFNTACIRRAIIVAACILGAALAA